MDINWEMVKTDAFTVIRMDWPVSSVQALADKGNETPASGDALARARHELVGR